MPYGRRQNALRPINSVKHELTWTKLGTNYQATQTEIIANPVQSPSADNEVDIGSRVNSVYFEFNCSGSALTNPTVLHWAVQMFRTAQTASGPTLYNQINKSQILKRGMEMIPKDLSTVIKRIFVVKIPPSFRRMRENQQIQIKMQASDTGAINVCGIMIYKEYK